MPDYKDNDIQIELIRFECGKITKGILILSLEGGEDIPEWLLEELYINGEKRYFEIHGGKIKLVV